MTNRPAEFDRALLAEVPWLRQLAERRVTYQHLQMHREDVAQDTVLRAMRYWTTYRPGEPMRPWLRLLMRRIVWELPRANPFMDGLDVVPDVAVPASQEQVVEAKQVLAAIDRLSPKQRDVMRMTAMGDSGVEIAAALGCTEQNVSLVRRRAREALAA